MGKHGKYRPLVKFIALLLACWPVAASAACRQALSLGLDVSGSVDRHEYALQINGLAHALLAEDVQQAFLAMPDAPVRLHIYVWAGRGGPKTILEWLDINTTADLLIAAETLRNTDLWRFSVETSLGDAMLFGASALNTQVDCWRRTLDISGDGKSSTGIAPKVVRNTAVMADITVNALVVGTENNLGVDKRQNRLTDLARYFHTDVIRGADAFVIQATDFDDFERAMAQKLLKELQTMAVGAAGNIAK